MSSQPEEQIVSIELQRKALFYGVWRSCLNCDFWQQAKAPSAPIRCKKFNSVPPTEVIVLSCPAWLPLKPF